MNFHLRIVLSVILFIIFTFIGRGNNLEFTGNKSLHQQLDTVSTAVPYTQNITDADIPHELLMMRLISVVRGVTGILFILGISYLISSANKRELITRYGIRALAAGTLVSLLSASIIGMIM